MCKRNRSIYCDQNSVFIPHFILLFSDFERGVWEVEEASTGFRAAEQASQPRLPDTHQVLLRLHIAGEAGGRYDSLIT